MAFVPTCTTLRSSFTSTVAKTDTRLGLNSRVSHVANVTMGTDSNMSGVFKDFLKAGTRDYTTGGGGKAYTGGAPAVASGAPAVARQTFRSNLAVKVPSQRTDGYKDTVTPKSGGRADKYMADNCVTAQYKAQANPTGVYSMSCTEGAASGEAVKSAELSNMAGFRQMQRPLNQKYFDFYETRKMAINMSHGCSYEEGLVGNFPRVAAATVRGYSEAKQLCVRYNTSIDYVKKCGTDTDSASAYMSNCVDMQYKQHAVPNGTYTTTCTDGNTAGVAEFKRTQALSARYRANMMPAGFKAQAKYDAKKYARSMFRTCSYEEEVFNNYPAVAASMRPLTARY